MLVVEKKELNGNNYEIIGKMIHYINSKKN